MKLISCTIENFGKLNNVTYDFSGECNTICEDTGWGVHLHHLSVLCFMDLRMKARRN